MIMENPEFVEWLEFENNKPKLKDNAPEWAVKAFEQHQQDKQEYDKEAGL